MKKKIRDLTYDERKRICDKQGCYNCPLYGNKAIIGYEVCLHDYFSRLEKQEDYLNREVEIENE